MKDPLPLLSKLFDGTLTESEAEELRGAIKGNPQFAEEVVYAASLHSGLRDLLAGQRELGGIPNEISGLGDAHIMPALEEEEEVAPQQEPAGLKYVRLEPRKREAEQSGVNSPARFRRHAFVKRAIGLGIAAAVMVGIGVGSWQFMNRPVASVANVMDVQWGNGQPALQAGDSLGKSHVAIAAGLLRVTFTGGASVVVQGPAEMQIDSATSMRLLSGRLTTAVPHEAIGFTVQTPAAAVVDLGTEVGIKVADDNQTHVEVFNGKAKVDMPDTAGTATMATATLEPAMAVNVQARGTSIEKAEPQPLAFVRQDELLERANEPESPVAALQAMRSKLFKDPTLLACYTFDNAAQAPGKLINRASATAGQMDGTVAGATWDQGHLPGLSALHFGNSKDSAVTMNLPGSFNQLTLATWVNFDQLGKEYGVLFAGDVRGPGSFDWKVASIDGVPQINIGVAADVGPTHYIGGVFDATGLTTGTWHYCVLNYDLEAKTLRCAMDGVWLKTLQGKPVDPMVLPARIDAARLGNELRKITDPRALHGRMDEFAIWTRTLSDDELSALYRAGGGH